MARPITKSVTIANVNLAGVAALQTTAGAGSLTLTAGAASLDMARNIALDSGGNISARTFTLIGLDQDGQAVTETMAGPNGNTVYSTKFYKSVTSITVDGAVGTNTRAGWDGTSSVGKLPTIALDNYGITAAMASIEITGTINFTVQETFDTIASGTASAIWYSVTALASKTANTRSQVSIGARAIQILVNTYSNGATISANVIQSRHATK